MDIKIVIFIDDKITPNDDNNEKLNSQCVWWETGGKKNYIKRIYRLKYYDGFKNSVNFY